MTHEPDDDQHWLDLMAGRAAPDADVRTRKEAAWLRAAMLSYRATAPQGAPAHADERVGRLLTRAREAGVLPAAANDTSSASAASAPALRKPGRPRWPQALAASVVLGGLLLVFLPTRHGLDPDDGVLRGAPVQRITTPDAATHRERLLLELRAAGFDAQPFERLGRPGIDVSLPVPLPPGQTAELKRLGLTPPTGPSLQIELVTPP